MKELVLHFIEIFKLKRFQLEVRTQEELIVSVNRKKFRGAMDYSLGGRNDGTYLAVKCNEGELLEGFHQSLGYLMQHSEEEVNYFCLA